MDLAKDDSLPVRFCRGCRNEHCPGLKISVVAFYIYPLVSTCIHLGLFLFLLMKGNEHCTPTSGETTQSFYVFRSFSLSCSCIIECD